MTHRAAAVCSAVRCRRHQRPSEAQRSLGAGKLQFARAVNLGQSTYVIGGGGTVLGALCETVPAGRRRSLLVMLLRMFWPVDESAPLTNAAVLI